jgi:hypothetical protein
MQRKGKERRTQERENTPEPIEEIHDAARKKKVECGDKAVEI